MKQFQILRDPSPFKKKKKPQWKVATMHGVPLHTAHVPAGRGKKMTKKHREEKMIVSSPRSIEDGSIAIASDARFDFEYSAEKKTSRQN
jgi:hypothetical protein